MTFARRAVFGATCLLLLATVAQSQVTTADVLLGGVSSASFTACSLAAGSMFFEVSGVSRG